MEKSLDAAVESFNARMANKADEPDGVPSVVMGEHGDVPQKDRPKYEYNIPVSFRCMSETCKGKVMGVTGHNIVMAALRGMRIDIECPGCQEPISLVASKDEKSKILRDGVIPMNREMRRKEKHMDALRKIVGPK